MKSKMLRSGLPVAGALALIGGLFFSDVPAYALLIVEGSTYSMSYATTGPNEYRVTLDIDTSGYNGGGLFLDEVAIKVSSSLSSVSLFDAPGGRPDWNLQAGGLNANGCNGKGQGYICLDYIGDGWGVPVKPVNNESYTFEFKLDTGGGALETAAANNDIKAGYVDDSGKKVGSLVSQGVDMTTVPEPSTLLLFIFGLTGLAGSMWRRDRK